MPTPPRFASSIALAISIVALAAPPAARAAATAAAPTHPRNVVLMIPDGCGPATLALARMVAGHPLALDGMLVGAALTHSSDARVTDSGAAATALATGHKTYNGGISEDTLHLALGTLLEAAEAKGLATGLVATSRITHATPAAFAAHVDQRASEDLIAAQMLEQGIEVLLGGGRSRFVPEAAGGERRDGRDLLAESRARGVEVLVDREGLERAARVAAPVVSLHVGRHAAAAPGARPLLGLFAMDHMEYALDQDSLSQPRLLEMTEAALARLSRAPRGFFLMVEGSRIDHAAHDNDAPATVREALEYDDAVRAVLEFARNDGRTLVISCADHETGGLTLARRIGDASHSDLQPEAIARVRHSAARMADHMRAGAPPAVVLRESAGVDSLDADERRAIADGLAGRGWLAGAIAEIVNRRARVAWATNGHTAADVGLYAFGPGRERFVGVHENSEVGREIARALGLDLEAVTARLRRDVRARSW